VITHYICFLWATIFSVCDSEFGFHPPRHTCSVARNSDDRSISMLYCVRPRDLLISRKAAATDKAEEKYGSKNPSHVAYHLTRIRRHFWI